MAIRIRLQRIGAKKKPFYRLVVADSRTARNGKVVDNIGTYNPHIDPPEIQVNFRKLDEWIAKGAQPSENAASILKRARRRQTLSEQ